MKNKDKGYLPKYNGGGFLNFLKNNSGDIANGINFAANEYSLSKAKTNVPFVSTPKARLQNRYNIAPELQAIDNSYRSFTEGIDRNVRNSGVSNALKSKAFADTLTTRNRVLANQQNQETALTNQEAMLNANIAAQDTRARNQNEMYNTQLYNQKLAAQASNRQSFLQGVIGNQEQRDIKKQTDKEIMLRAVEANDTGIMTRYAKQRFPGLTDEEALAQLLNWLQE